MFFSVSGLAVSKALAEDSEFTPPIISRLAEKFNLNEDEVQAVFDAVREEHGVQMQEQMQQQREERLNQAVADGVITQEQMDALLAKWQEMHEERNAERQQHRTEMDAWFESQGIDHEALMEYGGFGGRRGMGGLGYRIKQ